MARPLRRIRPKKLVEITCRTMQGRFLLKPSPELNRRVVGVLGRAQRQTGLALHAVVFASNHYHLLASPDTPLQLVEFMRHVQSNIAREAGDLYDWNGKFWSRRFRDVPVSDEPEAQIARLRYCLAHGVKEGLVARCRDWPGVHSAAALLDGEVLTGIWYDRTALYEARRRGERVRLADFATEETIELTPLPCWQHLEEEDVRERIEQLVAEIELEHHLDRKVRKVSVPGARAVRRRRPHDRPKTLKRGPAPRFHTATKQAWLALREGVQQFAESFRDAAEQLKTARTAPAFPEGSFPPNLPYVPVLAPG
jgi:REP element-mobilizing transposase RayT